MLASRTWRMRAKPGGVVFAIVVFALVVEAGATCEAKQTESLFLVGLDILWSLLSWRCGMAIQDFLESEVAVAVAVTAAALSPRVRGIVRRGLVYGVAGVLKAGDALSSAVQSAAAAAQHAEDSSATAGTASPRPSMMAAEAGAMVGMAGNAISAVARSAFSAAQQAAASAVQTVQEVTEEARAGMESGQDRPAPEGSRDRPAPEGSRDRPAPELNPDG